MNLEFVIQFYTFPSCNTPEKKHSSQKGAATLGFAYRADGSPPLVATKKTSTPLPSFAFSHNNLCLYLPRRYDTPHKQTNCSRCGLATPLHHSKSFQLFIFSIHLSSMTETLRIPHISLPYIN